VRLQLLAQTPPGTVKREVPLKSFLTGSLAPRVRSFAESVLLLARITFGTLTRSLNGWWTTSSTASR
jgi:hypothetical protein